MAYTGSDGRDDAAEANSIDETEPLSFANTDPPTED